MNDTEKLVKLLDDFNRNLSTVASNEKYIIWDDLIELAKYLADNDVTNVVHGYWINTPPYTASNGEYNKAQECSVCNAYFVSSGYTRYSNHSYCCECGAKMDGPVVWREAVS
jgi:hypothetical protein